MIKNYLKIALRRMRHERGYAFINITGLALGLASCLLIGLYVHRELSYGDFHQRADCTYRVLREFDVPDLHSTIDHTPSALAPALEEQISPVERAVRVNHRSPVVRRGTQKFVEPGFLWADEGFFEIFSFSLADGDAALDRPGTVVLTEKMAAKYFAGEPPIGQTIQIDGRSLEVTGIAVNPPDNSHLQFGFVGSMATLDLDRSWSPNNYVTYVLLGQGHAKAEVELQIAELTRRHTSPSDMSGNVFIPHLQPITGIHLGQGVPVEISSEGNLLYVYLFSALAVFVLILACINFTNLATARGLQRGREIGMRKTLGAGRRHLAAQFLGEALLTSLLALVLALGLVRIALPWLNHFTGTELTLAPFLTGPWLLAFIGLTAVTGILAGSYPAFALARFHPASVLRGRLTGGRGHWLRKGLVVFQFAMSVGLIAATLVVFNQLDYLRSKDLGFDQDRVIVVERAGYLGDQTDTFRQELRRLSGVAQVGTGYSLPGRFFMNSMVSVADGNRERQNVNYSFVGFEFIETLGVDMIAGRDFSREHAIDDSLGVVLNEAAARDLGWSPREAVGKRLDFGREVTVIGVTENFHYESLHEEIYPLLLFAPHRTQRYIAVRVGTDDIPEILEQVRGVWQQFSDLRFEHSFLADELAAQYRAEEQMARIFSLFTGLTILIACLGLFGLAAYATSRRTKEIGVRKVLGATVSGLVGLLSKDFLKLVGLAVLIAVPTSYLAIRQWLQNFAYHIEPEPSTFLVSAFLAIAGAFITVSYLAIKAALTNPADSLRYE